MDQLSSHKATAFLALACLLAFIYQIALNPASALVPNPEALLAAGANFGPTTIGEAQYWRLLSGVFLHCGLIHIGLNMAVLISFGPKIEDLLGKWRYVFIFFYSAVIGNLLSILVNPLNTSVGASGGLMGLIAALMTASWFKRGDNSSRLTRPQLIFLAASLAYSFVLGLTSEVIDNACHLGGFLAGALAGLILTNRASGRIKLIDSPPARTIALLALVPVLFTFTAANTESNIKVKAYLEQQQGIKLLKEKKYLHGLDHLNAALALTPENPSMLQDRARALIELGQIDHALKDLENVIAQKSEDYVPLMTRASAYHKLGKEDLAVADMSAAIKLKPTDAMLYNNRAWFELAQGKIDEALCDCDKALSLKKDIATIYDTRGMAYFLKGDNVSAGKDFNTALEQNSKDGAYYYHRALVRQAQKDAGADEDLKHYRELEYRPEAWEPRTKSQ